MSQFANYTDPTVNGSQLTNVGVGMNQTAGMPQTTGISGAGMQPMGQVQGAPMSTGGQQQGGNFWSQNGGAGMILGGISVLGSLWNSYQQHRLAREQMSFARETFYTNLENQTQTYNTALEDRIRARHNTEGRGSGETDAYLSEHRL